MEDCEMMNVNAIDTLQNRNLTAQQYISSLPKEVKKRIQALKRLQVETNMVEAKFFIELHQLEHKFQTQYEPILTKRAQIIAAEMEPTDEDCHFILDPSDPLSDEFVSLTVSDTPKIDAERKSDVKPDEKKENKSGDSNKDEKKMENSNLISGIPDFWLIIMKNVEMLREMVQPHDEEILKYLIDIRQIVTAEVGFKLEFVFKQNPFFTNQVLTKTYFFKFSPSDENPNEAIVYDGPEIIKCSGTVIDWLPNKNVTVRHIQKLQKHKGRGTKRVVMKTIQMDSFFNFFNPPIITEGEEIDEDVEELLQSDYEIGQFIRERIVPRAVLYFTGEACDDDEDDDDEEYDDYEEGDDEGQSEPDAIEDGDDDADEEGDCDNDKTFGD